MLKITIKKDGVTTNCAQFPTQSELDSWVQSHVSMGTFQFEDIEVPAVLDISGEELQAAYIKPKTHTYEVEDLTAKLAQEQINIKAQAYLDATDWLIIRELDEGTACPLEVKQERSAARARIIK